MNTLLVHQYQQAQTAEPAFQGGAFFFFSKLPLDYYSCWHSSYREYNIAGYNTD